MNLTIILFVIIGYTYLGVREFPSIDPAQVSIRTNIRTKVCGSQITEPLEKLLIPLMGLEILRLQFSG
jgi:HAE1 family hydrophobic/amphiphilic exporter-1/multidrug efflux pump